MASGDRYGVLDLLRNDSANAGPEADGTDTRRIISRRALLKSAALASGMASGGLAELALGMSPVNTPARGKAGASGRIPFSLIIDDGSPVDPLFYEIPGYETPLLVPRAFTQRVADIMDKYDLRGKLTIIPMPSCLGRLDQSLKRVPQEHLQGFLQVVRDRIQPRFDITPEFLTHLRAYDLKKQQYRHIFEDVWITGAPPEEIVEYFVLAFTILKNVGLNARGITSPWDSGIDVEKKYAKALADAHWQVFHEKLTWYFLYSIGWGDPRHCTVEYHDAARDQSVVSITANFPDLFWSMEKPVDERVPFINANIDKVLSADGRTGRIRQLIESGYPVILLTHWQSLYTQGTGLGLEGLAALAERIQKVFGNSIEWVDITELASRAVAAGKT
ncbi:MAG TPA: hypothetical protein VMO17_05760 [Terriglobia bacterium]|nr:hypothetical protein [Terriglobia bacterium]